MAPGSRVRGFLAGAAVAAGLFVLVAAVVVAVASHRPGSTGPAPPGRPGASGAPRTPDAPREPKATLGDPSGGTSGRASGVPGGVEVMAEERSGDRRMDLTLRSAALGDVTRVRLLLPEGWSRDAGRTWPVLWLLHGGLDDHRSWSASDVDGLTRDDPVIVVMPDGGRCGSYSDWYNGGDGGPPRWATHHLRELLPLLESRYAASRERAVAGYSMGGQGAMLYAAAGGFRAAASFSGALHTLMPGVDVAVMLGTTAGCPGTDWKRVWGDPREDREVWERHDPYHLADRLRGVRLYVASGDGGRRDGELFGDLTEELAHKAALAFTGRLEALDIPFEPHFYPGRHDMTYWNGELRRALPMLLRSVGAR
ncbi:alpha/beta hydrolase-fold protein [Streptosporangium sp. NPDC023615]|uniref:alpha/beta hydrolase n=1 Tax=Streptosporangium sp. NPDC023615 TaxID=3154794 RepID=UPI0034171662